ncbi:tetratricopeptide repeat protein [Bacillus thuringiensis]|uniref:tetratricopeptide repeat protein n=1 Tax=Bacillus thuringiensis TaxID=1428 RepID=UPI0036EC870D
MSLIAKLVHEKAVVKLLEETNQLNELMRNYLQVVMDKETVNHFERKTEISTIFEELESIKKQIVEIAIHTPSTKNRLLAKAYKNKGISLDCLERYEEAIEYFDKALKLNPDDNGILLNKGIALDQMGNHEEAIEYYDQIILDYEIIDSLIVKKEVEELKEV